MLEETERAGLAAARMEYVYFLDSLDYFETASIVDVDRVIAMVLSYIDAEIEKSTICDVSADLFCAKIHEIATTLEAAGWIGRYAEHLHTLESIFRKTRLRLPIGPCHGDLTFSNIMIASDSGAIALIDFLDSFIEYPSSTSRRCGRTAGFTGAP